MKRLAILAVLVLVGCSSGGGPAPGPSPTPTPAPVAYCYDPLTPLEGKPWKSGVSTRFRMPVLPTCGLGARVYAIQALTVGGETLVNVAAQDEATAKAFAFSLGVTQ